MSEYAAGRRWGAWAVRGSRDRLDAVVADLNVHLPVGWLAGAGDHPNANTFQYLETAGLYRCPSASGRGIITGLVWWPDGSLRGGRVARQDDLGAGDQRLMQLLDEGIAPAARRAGAELHMPSPADLFLDDLPYPARDRLKDFSAASRKVLPLTWAEAERWHAFTVTAFREGAVLETDDLAYWLVADGWPPADAAGLAGRFFDESLLLTRYTDQLVIR